LRVRVAKDSDISSVSNYLAELASIPPEVSRSAIAAWAILSDAAVVRLPANGLPAKAQRVVESADNALRGAPESPFVVLLDAEVRRAAFPTSSWSDPPQGFVEVLASCRTPARAALVAWQVVPHPDLMLRSLADLAAKGLPNHPLTLLLVAEASDAKDSRKLERYRTALQALDSRVALPVRIHFVQQALLAAGAAGRPADAVSILRDMPEPVLKWLESGRAWTEGTEVQGLRLQIRIRDLRHEVAFVELLAGNKRTGNLLLEELDRESASAGSLQEPGSDDEQALQEFLIPFRALARMIQDTSTRDQWFELACQVYRFNPEAVPFWKGILDVSLRRAGFTVPEATQTPEDLVSRGIARRLVEDLSSNRLRTKDPTADTDGDGLPDQEERRRLLDPSDPDTDQDGLPDGRDPFPLVPRAGTNPLAGLTQAVLSQRILLENPDKGISPLEIKNEPLFVVSDRTFFTGVEASSQQVIVLTPDERRRAASVIGTRKVVVLEIPVFDQVGMRAIVRLSEGSTCDVLVAELRDGRWTFRGLRRVYSDRSEPSNRRHAGSLPGILRS